MDIGAFFFCLVLFLGVACATSVCVCCECVLCVCCVCVPLVDPSKQASSIDVNRLVFLIKRESEVTI